MEVLGAWSACSETCGNGTRSRKRECTTPIPAGSEEACYGGEICTETLRKSYFLYLVISLSLVPGNWSTWSDWSSCSETCGYGTRVRTRSCNNPAPAHGGATCQGDTINTDACFVRLCPSKLIFNYLLFRKQYIGELIPDSPWSACSETCGNGTRSRKRECTTPIPAGSEEACYGGEICTETCFIRHCPIPGNWSTWSDWSSCSETCGYGTRVRTRSCNNPAPAHGGATCQGDTINTDACFVRPCP
ncbi:unnamed protein product, partial [Porites lobata]